MIAVYPGSFDPVTNGHMDIIRRGARFADTLVVGLLINPGKKSLFSTEERLKHLELATGDIPNVRVKFFAGFLTDFAKENGASVVIRGLRTNVIPEYELQMALGNHMVSGGLETLFILSNPEYMYLSSTLVREVISVGGKNIEGMVPECVLHDIRRKLDANE